MHIIPVIDLIGGAVVHARLGNRADYRPIATPLATSSAPVDVTRGLLTLHAFSTLYVADLDAIAGRPGNAAALRGLKAAFPNLAIWLDNGAAAPRNVAHALRQAGLGHRDALVLGSESQADAALAAQAARAHNTILSLDFRGDAFLGPPALLDTPGFWPGRVIVMTLARVGGGAGPDFARLAAIKARAGTRAVYAAGGLRGLGDARALAAAGIAGALVATALHDGRLTRADLDALTPPRG